MKRAHAVAVLLLEPVDSFEAAVPAQVLARALDAADVPLYEVVTCAPSGRRPVATTAGHFLVAAAGMEALQHAQTVIVPGTAYRSAQPHGALDHDVERVLRSLNPSTRYASSSTGAFVLAASGILDGLRATTHWQNASEFRALFPSVMLDEAALVVDEGTVLTSAGQLAAVDLCLHILRVDQGNEVANSVAKYHVVAPWRDGGQTPFIISEAPLGTAQGDRTSATRAWAQANLRLPLTVADLAAHAGLSPRTFSRRFLAETGLPPGAWLLARRLDSARELLEAQTLSIDVIAVTTGFGSSHNLRYHLRRALGMSPSTYIRGFGRLADGPADVGRPSPSE